jgi:hypothetical protein
MTALWAWFKGSRLALWLIAGTALVAVALKVLADAFHRGRHHIEQRQEKVVKAARRRMNKAKTPKNSDDVKDDLDNGKF